VKDPIQEAERAEFWQSVKALLIPLSLFLAVLAAAAGTFLVYNAEPVGWLFLAGAGAVMVAAIVGLIRFQNQHRVRGVITRSKSPELEEDARQADAADHSERIPAKR
jgi:uncharacterized membrane protein